MIDEALEHLVKGIVDNPDEVVITEKNTRGGTTLEVRVHPEDIGKVIGRNGRTAKDVPPVVSKKVSVPESGTEQVDVSPAQEEANVASVSAASESEAAATDTDN